MTKLKTINYYCNLVALIKIFFKTLKMEETAIAKNWRTGTTLNALRSIHDKGINIAIYNRDIAMLEKEVDNLLAQEIEFEFSGDIPTILHEIKKVIAIEDYQMIYKDIADLLHFFEKISASKNLRFLLGTVNTNMCRRFHTDVNDLRLLCTYAGPGTLWLTEDNVNRVALDNLRNNEAIVIDENSIQQVETGNVVILKGAKYIQNNTRAVVHRSPSIEKSNEKRLLLRIDTNEL